MSHRTQITLTDEQYRRLKRRSHRTGVSLSELVRRALEQAYGSDDSEWEEALDATFGLWKDRSQDEIDAILALRGPGLGHRLGL